MRELFIGALVSACLISGLLLRYEAISSLVTREKQRILLICYAVALIMNTVALWLWFSAFGLSLAPSKYSGVVFAAVTTAINILVVRKQTKAHLFSTGIVMVCNYLLLAVPSYVNHVLEMAGASISPFFTVAVYAAVLLLSFFPIRKLLGNTVKPFLSEESGHYWGSIWFLPIAMFGMLFLAFPGNRRVESLSAVLGGILCAAVMILMCWRIAEDYRQMQHKQIMEEQLADQKLYYAQLQAKVEEARKTGHDFKHFAQAMRHYLSNDDMEGLRSCCIDLTQRLNQASAICDVGNSVADAVLYRYGELAREEKIQVKVQGELICDWISDMDICVLLGNLLDNAIEGCKTMEEDRRLAITFQHTESAVCMLIQNTYDGLVKMEDGEMLSRKRERLSGIGLKSVEELCQKYRGQIDICPDETLFSVNVLLKKAAD